MIDIQQGVNQLREIFKYEVLAICLGYCMMLSATRLYKKLILQLAYSKNPRVILTEGGHNSHCSFHVTFHKLNGLPGLRL